MKKILVIANLEHASPRIPALLTYLSDLGWSATVITPELNKDTHLRFGFPEDFLSKVTIQTAPFRGDVFWPIRKLLGLFGFSKNSSYTEQLKEEVSGSDGWVDRAMRAFQTIFAFPDTEWPWHRSALRVASIEIEKNAYDAILSSSPHPTSHRVASKLQKSSGLPWVADFRDPWSQSHNYTMPAFRQKLDKWLETRTIRNAVRVITVSEGFALKLRLLHGDKVSVIRNGYQPVVQRPSITLPEKFTISYTGTIYDGKQDPTKILKAIDRLIESGKIQPSRFTLEFYGRYDSKLQQSINFYSLNAIVLQKGILSREEIRRRQMSSHLLLLLQWEDPKEQGIFPLKFYEYLDARRPILATGGAVSSELVKIIRETEAGSSAIDIDDIVMALEGAYAEFISTGELQYTGKVDRIEKYSYVGSAKALNNIIEQVVT